MEAQPGQEPTGVLGEQTSTSTWSASEAFSFLLDQMVSGDFVLTTESAGEESELLCVSNLPSDATEVCRFLQTLPRQWSSRG